MRNFAPRAQVDLDELVSWLLDRGSSAEAAERLLASVLEAVERLGARPHLGRRRPELLPDRFRFWSLPRYRIVLVYRVDPSPMTIVRVLSTDRDLGPLLADLKTEQPTSEP